MEEDLGIVIESKEVIFWKDVKKNAEEERTRLENHLSVNSLILTAVEQKLKELSN